MSPPSAFLAAVCVSLVHLSSPQLRPPKLTLPKTQLDSGTGVRADRPLLKGHKSFVDGLNTINGDEIDRSGPTGAECGNCVDESLPEMNKYSMPIFKYREKKYYLGTFFKANWFKASQYCRYHGMHLASISSQEENDKLEETIKSYGYAFEHFWVSGTDLAEEGQFFWMSTGRPITFTNWNAGEPNNFRYENGEEENCLELWDRDGKGLKWNDSACSFETYFVCEAVP